MANPQPGVTPWYFKRLTILIGLVCLYPVAVALLKRSPRHRPWEKIAGTLFFLPVFAGVVLLALYPFWDFGGGLQLAGCSLDLGRIRQYDRLEQHRARQQESEITPKTTVSRGSTWTDFRGPRRDGVVTGARISLDWNANPPREIYRQPIGEGYASFVVANGRAYTIEQRRDNEAVTCYDVATGREIWIFEYKARFEETLGGDGPRATPTLFNDRLYALGAEGDLHCLSTDSGKPIWARNILQENRARNLTWGLSGSPLVMDDRVYVTGSGQGGASILAFDARNGNPIWNSDAGVQSYSSLMHAVIAGKSQLLNLAGNNLNGVDPETGAVLWSYPWKTEYAINVGQPILAGADRVFIASGYGHGCALLAIEWNDGALRARELWSNTRMKNKFTSSVLYEGHVYGLDERILACVNLESGERRWKGGRYNYGSVLLVDDHILILGEEGELALVRATPEAHREVGRIQLFDNRTWNNFVLIGSTLLARNHKEMVCFDLSPRVP